MATRSPAEAYEQARTRASHPQLSQFAAELSFELDDFQRQSCVALEQGHGVLVCAPTGAGKTVVGEFAVHLALARGQKCFYTTPIKALSNQKYADLVERHGADAVGLLTGDAAINGSAPVVVMTTEVLRNMLYAESPALEGLAYVVMDEVHYLADRFRGAVWEEVILHLPQHVQIASLSATVSNAEEFGDWLVTVRGDTTVVVDETRPVPLWQHMVVGHRMFDLFAEERRGGATALTVDPTLVRAVAEVDRGPSVRGGRARSGPPGRGGRPNDRRGGPARSGPPGRGGGSGFRPPSRVDVIERLDAAGLLPAITFIFSRAGCDAAVTQCVRSGLRLTGPDDVGGHPRGRRAQDRGPARGRPRRPGLLGVARGPRARRRRPPRGHAAGVQGDRRGAVRPRPRAGGVRHRDPRAGHQHARADGRAREAREVQRRGPRRADAGGVHPAHRPGGPARHRRRGPRGGGLGSPASTPNRSPASPRPARTRCARRSGPATTWRSTSSTASGSRAPASCSSSRSRSSRPTAASSGWPGASSATARPSPATPRPPAVTPGTRATSGPSPSTWTCAAGSTDREKLLSRQGRSAQKAEAAASLEALKPGDVIAVPGGKRAGLAVVLDPGIDRSPRDQEPRPLVLTEDRWAGRLSLADFPEPVAALGTMKLPRKMDHRVPRLRRDLANALRETGIEPPTRSGSARRRRGAENEDPELASLRRALRAHPCHGLADRDDRSRWFERYQRLERETEQLQDRVRSTTHSLARTFDRIRGLLGERGYLDDEDVTEDGRRLSRLWGESDLLVAECLRHGVWRGLGPAEIAAVASSLVYDSRRDDGGVPRVPEDATSAVEQTVALWHDLVADERRHRLDRTREPDLGFAWPVHRWVRGDSLAVVLAGATSHGTELSAGDFVRWCRQVVDLLDQIRAVAGNEDTVGRAAGDAVRAIRRGVVAVGEG